VNDGDAKALAILALDGLGSFVIPAQNGDLCPNSTLYAQSYTHAIVSHPDIMNGFFTGFSSSRCQLNSTP
jgi:hypothetical protein